MAADPAVLHKVRSLLAKAESTSFPDEAEALTAKAQQLMDRHAIDRAVLAASAAGSDGPEGRTVVVEAPYARPKVQLLTEVAVANRCRAVWNRGTDEATVVGFPDDRERVELLYTSLLIQSTTAMLAAGVTAASRSRSYRQSFLVAYAGRIGERLRAAARATVTAAAEDLGESVLPVLADRALAVDEALADAFPHLRTMRVSSRDPAGHRAGLDAADRARLGEGDAVSTRVRRGLRRS